MGCCGKADERSGDKEPKSLKKRTCTDVLCLILFIALLGVLAGIAFLAIWTGDWQELYYEQDYLGNRCGVGEMADKPKAFYPRIPRDMLEEVNRGHMQTGSFWKLKLYALCVAKCPKTFNIDDASSSLITDYGYDITTSVTQSLGKGTQKEWLSATPTLDIVNRCIPREQSSQNTQVACAYPKCTDPDVSAVGGTCLDSGSGDADTAAFTNGEWTICPAGVTNCADRQDVCKVKATESTTRTYMINAEDDAGEAMLAGVAKQVGGVFEIVTAIANAWYFIVIGGIAAPLAIALVYMVLLFLFAKTIIYGMLGLLIVCELAATFICFARSGISFSGVDATALAATATAASNVSLPSGTEAALAAVNEESRWMYAVGFLILGIASVVTIIMVVTSRKKIRICAAIIKESTTVFTSMPLLMLFPSVSTLAQILVCAWFVAASVLIYTTKPESFDSALGIVANTTYLEAQGITQPAVADVDPIGSLRDFTENDNFTLACLAITLFGFYVLIQFVQGIAWCTMSASVYFWYFFKKNPAEKMRFPIATSLGRTLFYHTGSVAFSAFVIAVCDMLRTVAAYVEKQMGPVNNFLVKLAFKVIQCCLACIKKTVKFVSYYGLVFVGCQGSSFCGGCFKTFFFFLQNPGQVAMNALVTWLLKWISLLSIPLACAVVFFYIMDQVLSLPNSMYPAAIIFVTSALMTTAWMTVFDCTITTIFVSCFQDKAEFGGKFMASDHKRLAQAFGIKTKSGGTVEVVAESKEPATDSKADITQSL